MTRILTGLLIALAPVSAAAQAHDSHAPNGHESHAPAGEASTPPTPISATGAAADVQAVTQVIQTLFDGMRAGDSTMLRPLFHDEARMVTTGMREGAPIVMVEDVDGFIQFVGSPHEQVFDEHIADVEIRVDQNLAMAWMNYEFYLGDRFSHCGVDLMHLVRTSEGWRIIELGDTRRREGC